jgi:hypothetical protein
MSQIARRRRPINVRTARLETAEIGSEWRDLGRERRQSDRGVNGLHCGLSARAKLQRGRATRKPSDPATWYIPLINHRHGAVSIRG